MRNIIKNITVPVDGEPKTFRLKKHELWDGTYTLGDLLDIAELIRIRAENEYRAREAASYS